MMDNNVLCYYTEYQVLYSALYNTIQRYHIVKHVIGDPGAPSRWGLPMKSEPPTPTRAPDNQLITIQY